MYKVWEFNQEFWGPFHVALFYSHLWNLIRTFQKDFGDLMQKSVFRPFHGALFILTFSSCTMSIFIILPLPQIFLFAPPFLRDPGHNEIFFYNKLSWFVEAAAY